MDIGDGTPPTRVNQTNLSAICFYAGLQILFSPTVARKYENKLLQRAQCLILIIFKLQ
jgi:hypothetical protein